MKGAAFPIQKLNKRLEVMYAQEGKIKELRVVGGKIELTFE